LCDNLETLYGAIEDGALAVRIPKHTRKELEAYLDCGLLCRGFARLRCDDCGESRLVAFSCYLELKTIWSLSREFRQSGSCVSPLGARCA
jgi:hypothetical protein